MKAKLLLAACFSIAIAISGFMKPAKSSNPSLTIKNGKISINGSAMSNDWKIGPFKKALGEPSKTREGMNKTHTYDEKGIVLFEKADKTTGGLGIINEFQYYLSTTESPNAVTPSGFYTGKIKVDKLEVNSNLTSAIMLAKLKGWENTKSYTPHCFRMSSKGIYIYFQFNDDENKLIKLSVGPDKKS